MNREIYQRYVSILRGELVPAMAYVAKKGKEVLRHTPERET